MDWKLALGEIYTTCMLLFWQRIWYPFKTSACFACFLLLFALCFTLCVSLRASIFWNFFEYVWSMYILCEASFLLWFGCKKQVSKWCKVLMSFFSILTCLKTSEDLFQDLKQLTVSAVWKRLIVGSGIHNSIMGRTQLQHQVGIHLFCTSL